MIKIGIISDIHADYEALTVAIQLLIANHVDKIICLGDVVEKGLDGDSCAEMLDNWLISCVRGNHDELAIVNQNQTDDNPRWHNLQDSTLLYLRNLPLTLYYVWQGTRIVMCHGSPTDTWEYLHTDFAKPKRFKQVALSQDADIVLCGHSHRPMDITYKDVRFLNPGSVCGRHTQGSRTCGILRLSDNFYQILDLPE